MIRALYAIISRLLRLVEWVTNFLALIGFAAVIYHFGPYLPGAWEGVHLAFHYLLSILEIIDAVLENVPFLQWDRIDWPWD